MTVAFRSQSGTCPPWCDDTECTADGERGMHQSAIARIEATGNEPCSVAVSLLEAQSGPLLVAVEAQHDPNISAALGMPTEADVYLYSPTQAKRMQQALERLLHAL